MDRELKIGIAGSGFIARGLAMALEVHRDLRLSSVLTRRPIQSCREFPRTDLLTNSLNELVDECDLIIECSGDVLHATEVVDKAVGAGRPVITMDAEFHVTTGAYFVGRGMVTEAQGDQPGSLAALAEEARLMGFSPLVYGNRKGYYNANPSLEQMKFWSAKQGLSLDQVTAATDGTKIQIEQALVANGLGATIAVDGLLGLECETLQEGGQELAQRAAKIGSPIADYVIAPKAPAGIFIVAEHDQRQQPYLEYLKMGEGPYYVLVHNYHLCHLEIIKTIRRVMEGKPALLNNSARPTISVAAIAKRELKPGEAIRRGIGSFDLRGEAVRVKDHADHIPIGLISDAVVARTIDAGQCLTFGDVEISDSLALKAWRAINGAIAAKTKPDTGSLKVIAKPAPHAAKVK